MTLESALGSCNDSLQYKHNDVVHNSKADVYFQRMGGSGDESLPPPHHIHDTYGEGQRGVLKRTDQRIRHIGKSHH
ncbi:hypothetical protein D3C86_2188180 [compost metagenome]